ncbi:MAG: metallophosphoesterase [Nanoarchaeota archaeon]|nr:metallophosphoesterase [Nanoarchaeota archaeon]
MKLLVLGDFHGKFPSKLYSIIKKEKIDLVVSIGDYPPFHYRKLWFKHCYGKEKELWEVIGKKKYKELVMNDLKRGEEAIRKLNNVSVPVFTVLGNIDYPSTEDASDFKPKINKGMPNWEKKNLLLDRLKSYHNIQRFDYKALRFGDLVFIGMRGHSFPGRVKSKGYAKHKKILEKLFNKFKKENKSGKVIFVSHITPYNTKLDKMGLKPLKAALKGDYGKVIKKSKLKRHYGSKMARRIILKYQPILFFGGHIHESKGKQKLGKTLLINPGAIHEGNFSIVDIDNEKGKINSSKILKIH